jgi:hypothetical protein
VHGWLRPSCRRGACTERTTSSPTVGDQHSLCLLQDDYSDGELSRARSEAEGESFHRHMGHSGCVLRIGPHQAPVSLVYVSGVAGCGSRGSNAGLRGR